MRKMFWITKKRAWGENKACMLDITRLKRLDHIKSFT